MAGWSVPGVVPLREVREDAVGRRVLARHRITRKSLAITYLSGELLADSEFRTRFARDFAQWVRVRDARVARVHRYCESPQGVAIIGDHLIGTSLRTLLVAQGALSTEAALVVLQDSLRALAACHQVGLVHGDVKPEGVILTPAGQLRLVDAGLWTSSARRLLARSTPFYLAPEQWDGPAATPVGDVYAAAVMFFECLAGAPPFYAEGGAELSAKHQQGVLPLDVVPQPVRELVLRGLDKDPRRRPEARSLLAQLGEVAARAAGADWQRRGRRELRALLAGRSALPEVSLPLRSGPRAGWPHLKQVRLAAVMGGALALAAGLASPPLAAVILPGGSIFGSSGRSPVLAFPEPGHDAVPDHDAGPVRVVPHGQRADHALPRAAKARSARPVVTAHPPARSTATSNTATSNTPMPDTAMPDTQTTQDEHATPLRADSLRQSISDQRTPTPPACTPPRLLSGYKPCTEAHLEQPRPVLTGLMMNPPRVLIPVSIPVQVPVSLPVRVEVPVPILQSISIGKKTQLDGDIHSPKGAPIPVDPQGWGEKVRDTGP
jgi:eukaryotic-like serine/threonine-protein kinase